jgi:muramidase (phage lysozyme)
VIRAAVGGVLLWAAWEYYRASERSAAGGLVEELNEAAGAAVDYAEGILAVLNIRAMKTVDRAALGHPNVQAFLRVIRTGEGTADDGGYRRLFGGGTFSSFDDHPRQVVKKGGYVSTAAGAYQFLASTWDETKKQMGLPDFSPRSQDLGALGRVAARGALADVLAGRFDSAVRKCAWEWASLPGSPYGQPVISWERARAIFANAGGNIYA